MNDAHVARGGTGRGKRIVRASASFNDQGVVSTVADDLVVRRACQIACRERNATLADTTAVVQAERKQVAEKDGGQRVRGDAVREKFGTDYGVGLTGAAGPDPHDGKPGGTVWVAIASGRDVRTRELLLSGMRNTNRIRAVKSAMHMLIRMIGDTAVGNK